jgi:hypothetical protein
LVLTDVRSNMMVMGVPARIKLAGGRPQRFVKKAEETVPAAETKAVPAAAPEPQRTAASVSV